VTIETNVWNYCTLIHINEFLRITALATKVRILGRAAAWAHKAWFVRHFILKSNPALADGTTTLALCQVGS
jgi:hypothetical protein